MVKKLFFFLVVLLSLSAPDVLAGGARGSKRFGVYADYWFGGILSGNLGVNLSEVVRLHGGYGIYLSAPSGVNISLFEAGLQAGLIPSSTFTPIVGLSYVNLSVSGGALGGFSASVGGPFAYAGVEGFGNTGWFGGGRIGMIFAGGGGVQATLYVGKFF